jgi:Tannase and feruloyl esterase
MVAVWMQQSVQRELIALPRRCGHRKRLPFGSADRGAKRRGDATLLRLPNAQRRGPVGPWPAFILGDLETWFGNGTAGTQQGFYRGTSVRPEAITSAGLDYQIWKANVEPRAKLYDASNPDIDGFKARGGKLLIVQGTTDMLVPTAMTTRYVKDLSARHGAQELRKFVRYYVVPGYGHGRSAFNVQWDSLAALDTWVETRGLVQFVERSDAFLNEVLRLRVDRRRVHRHDRDVVLNLGLDQLVFHVSSRGRSRFRVRRISGAALPAGPAWR